MKRLPGEPFLKIGWVELKKTDLVFLAILMGYLAVMAWLALGMLKPSVG